MEKRKTGKDLFSKLILFLFNLASVLPLLAAKQRMTHANDWMTTDAVIACPDPHCKSQLKITRTGVRKFRHSETTATQLN